MTSLTPPAGPDNRTDQVAGWDVPVQPRLRSRLLRQEVALVLALSLGASAVYALLVIIARMLASRPLSDQTATMNSSRASQPWLDLALQLLNIGTGVAPALLAVYLLARFPGRVRDTLGLDARRPRFDLLSGAGLAALIGIPGLGLYAAGRWLGITVKVQPADLPDVWWAVPVLILAAAQNAVLEEIVVVGYLLTRLRELSVRTVWAVAATAVLRGSYHLYQGFGAFIGNAIMGVVFAVFFLRTRRIVPLIVAHTILDVVSFVGYALLADRLPFLR